MTAGSLLIRIVGRQSAGRFDAMTRDPSTVQRELLFDMIRRNAGTEYGKRFGFADIRTEADYRKQVPLITYESIAADMKRVAAGASNVFTAEDPVMFAQTSGTTGEPKFVPVTAADHGRAHRDQMRTWMYHALQAHPDLYRGKIVSLVSPAVEGYTESGKPYGSTSGHIYKNFPWLITRTYSIPYPVFEIPDYAAKYYAIMRLSLADDISFICTANPSSVIKMCEKANEHAEEIIRDIRDGTLSKSYDIPDEIRSSVEKRLRADPARAKALETMRAKRQGVLKPGDYWPQIALIGCWKGGTVGHYLGKFPDWFDPDGRRPVAVRDWGYLSSEARCSIPLSDEGCQGVVTIGTNYFEFVEVAEVEANPDSPASWNYHGVSEIQEGREYYIFFTTTSGFYRYDINDVVKVTGRYNATPQIVFLRKGRGQTNLTGEKLSVNQVIAAHEAVAEATGITPDHFKAEADGERSRYIFRIEFAQTTTEAEELRFLEGLDRELKRINMEYKSKRDSGRLHAPVLHVMREGWYERERREQVASGKRAFQAKTVMLDARKMATMAIRPEIVRVIEMPGD